jgi:transposase
VLGERPKARVLIEASTESEWVARCLEELGHEVIVADPNFAAMYATRSKRVKTDRRDARTLAEVCRLGAYRPAHRTSEEQRRGRITKSGNARARWLLVEAAWAVWRSRTAETAALRAWAQRIASRRGKRVAMVALTRRPAGILFAMWRDGTSFEPQKIRMDEPGEDPTRRGCAERGVRRARQRGGGKRSDVSTGSRQACGERGVPAGRNREPTDR